MAGRNGQNATHQDFPLRRGGEEGRLVCFEYCVSLLAVTLRRTSAPVAVPPGGRAWVRGLPYTLISLFLGWWGVPWGLLWTPAAIAVNFRGGHDVTGRLPAGRGGE